jgi:cupin 2 domain-containing protein
MKKTGNIFEDADAPAKGELFLEILRHKNVRIERIVSSDELPEKIYNQEHDEWVMILEGGARLDVDGKRVCLSRGDWLLLKSGIPHRILSTMRGTVWLAVHLD